MKVFLQDFIKVIFYLRNLMLIREKLHLSTLIISNQMKRNKAIQILKSKPYNNFDLESDKDYFLKKMKWSYNDLNKYINSKEISHLNYPTEIKFWNNLIKLKVY